MEIKEGGRIIMPERLRKYLASERQKLRPLSPRKRAEYVWQYYHLWILAMAAALGLVLYVGIHRATVPPDNWISLAFANTYGEAGERSPLWRDFVRESGYDTGEKNVYFNGRCYFDPADSGYNGYYTYFVAYVEAGTLDAIVMEREDLEELGRKGWLLDLTLPAAGDLAERYRERLLYAVPLDPDYSTDPVPIGIDLSDTALVSRYHIYAETCALGVSANFPHPEALNRFLEFLLADTTESDTTGPDTAEPAADTGEEDAP